MDVFVLGHAQAELSHVVQALSAARRFAGGLDGRQQQRDQHADDGDDHQQFDERKGTASPDWGRTESTPDTAVNHDFPPSHWPRRDEQYAMAACGLRERIVGNLFGLQMDSLDSL